MNDVIPTTGQMCGSPLLELSPSNTRLSLTSHAITCKFEDFSISILLIRKTQGQPIEIIG